MRGSAERAVDVAALEGPAEGLIGPELGVGECGAGLETALRIRDRRKRLVVDLDQVGRVAGQRGGLGDDRRDGDAGRIDDRAGEIGTRRLLQPGDRRHEGERPQRTQISGRRHAK